MKLNYLKNKEKSLEKISKFSDKQLKLEIKRHHKRKLRLIENKDHFVRIAKLTKIQIDMVDEEIQRLNLAYWMMRDEQVKRQIKNGKQ